MNVIKHLPLRRSGENKPVVDWLNSRAGAVDLLRDILAVALLGAAWLLAYILI